MYKKITATLLAALLVCSLAACGSISSETGGQDTETLVSTYADKFEQLTYADPETGLSITYNLFYL